MTGVQTCALPICFLIYISENPQQTEKVLAYQRRCESGLTDRKEKEKLISLFKAAQLQLSPVDVVIPFGEDLDIPAQVFKKLRSNKHYLTLIKAIAFWNQKQRPWKKKADGSHYIEATLNDVEWANFLCKEALLRKSDELPPAVREFFENLKQYVKSADDDNRFYAKDIRKTYRLHPETLRRHLSELESRGFIRCRKKSRKIGDEYEILILDDYQQLKNGINILDDILDKLKKKDSGK